MLENPRRARERMLPSLELVTLTGDYISNEDLLGRVVLLDFWGTWCEPCRMAVPSLKALVERSTKSPLTVISIATDQDDVVLKEFISGHGMSWPQVWDRDHKIVRSMSVSSDSHLHPCGS
ncbi:MAG: TlpA disulfide reductase family protein [Thermoanaerobaculia bacterium]